MFRLSNIKNSFSAVRECFDGRPYALNTTMAPHTTLNTTMAPHT